MMTMMTTLCVLGEVSILNNDVGRHDGKQGLQDDKRLGTSGKYLEISQAKNGLKLEIDIGDQA